MNERSKRLNQLRRKMNGNSSTTSCKTEPYALCYYLYTMFLDKENKKLFDRFDEAIKCFDTGISVNKDNYQFYLKISKVLKKLIKNGDIR